MKSQLKFTIRGLRREDLPGAAELYGRVFGGPPWNEVSIDPKGNFSSALAGTLCACCGGLLTDAYPKDKTERYIADETLNKGDKSRAYLAMVGVQMVAFGWGYMMESMDELIEKKYPGLPNGRFKDWLRKSDDFPSGPFTYVSEVGTEVDYRGNGIASRLLREVDDYSDRCVLRTMRNSPMASIAEKAGYSLATTDRQREGREKKGISVDPINPARVLYTRTPIIRR